MKLKTDPGWQLQADGNRARLDIYDVIGEDWMGGVSARAVRAELEKHEELEQIDVHINSPGGSAFDGITIYNVLAQHEANVTVHIDGLAASAASVIAMAGDEIRMAENALMMIHNASGLTIGNADDHREMAQTLDKLDGTLATTYARRTDGDRETIAQQMTDETWFTAEEAVADGFADTVVEAKKAAASFDPSILNKFKHPPASVVERFSNVAAPAATSEEHDDMASNTATITPEAFAEQNPDAVDKWKREAVDEAREGIANEAHSKGFDEGVENERGRVKALAAAFAKHPKFLAEQIGKGHDVGKAKAEAFDAQLGLDDGHDGIALDANAAVENEDTAQDEATKAKIKKAKAITNAYARTAYCNSVGLDPELVTAE